MSYGSSVAQEPFITRIATDSFDLTQIDQKNRSICESTEVDELVASVDSKVLPVFLEQSRKVFEQDVVSFINAVETAADELGKVSNQFQELMIFWSEQGEPLTFMSNIKHLSGVRRILWTPSELQERFELLLKERIPNFISNLHDAAFTLVENPLERAIAGKKQLHDGVLVADLVERSDMVNLERLVIGERIQYLYRLLKDAID